MLAAKDELFTRPSGGYTIARSVRLRSSATAYLNRTPSSSTNRRISTFSAWVKWSLTGSSAYPEIFSAAANGLLYKDAFYFSNNTLAIIFNGGVTYSLVTTQVFRDPSAWYHFVMAIDTTQATASNRVKLYVNGAQVTAFGTANYPTQNYDPNFNSAIVHNIGRSTDANDYYDGYLTEVNFIDGQALTPSSFGETDSITGVWKAKKYSGTYGTNGFYLNFSDNSNNTAATIGKDYSGNGNNWTPNNISVTAGSTYDSMTDVPTLTSLTAANYATWNPLAKGSDVSTAAGNLEASWSNVNGHCIMATMTLPQTGKWKCEITGVYQVNFGITPIATQKVTEGIGTTVGYGYRGTDGQKVINGSYSAYGATYGTSDVITLLYNADTLVLEFKKNNTSQGTISVASDTYVVGVGYQSPSAGTAKINFGQQPFTYTDSGYLALNTYNLPASTIKNGAAYMAATTYTGNGSTQTISNAVNGVAMQPDLIWIKSRSNAFNNFLTNSVAGATQYLISNSTDAEANAGSVGITAFNSNGFSMGSGAALNTNAATYVGWQWKAGTTSASNTNGSITSTVSVGATQGFSVVTYTGTGTSGQTVGHGLGVKPAFIIVKRRTGAGGWVCWHQSLTGGSEQDRYIYLDLTSASGTTSSYWGSGITSSTFGVWATGGDNNASGATLVAYCFSAIAGYSAFGSYTGNGSADGPFVYTGFRPRFILTKDSSATGNWFIQDTSRGTYNAVGNSGSPDSPLAPNTSGSETDWNGTFSMDILSNGFKLRNTATSMNTSGDTYIYAAFAENPFKNALAR